MENRVELVRAAVARRNPARLPILFFNQDREESDLILIDVVRHFQGPSRDRSEWGFAWEHLDRTMGQPRAPVLRDWDELDRLAVPDARDASRFAAVAETQSSFGERYYLASLVLTGFTIMSFLRGFSDCWWTWWSGPAMWNGWLTRCSGSRRRCSGSFRRTAFTGRPSTTTGAPRTA